MTNAKTYLGLDVGSVRIGAAIGSSDVRIAVPQPTIQVDGTEVATTVQLAVANNVDELVVGYPRNQSGETTAQTAYVEKFADELRSHNLVVNFYDESLSSVRAEERLGVRGNSYRKGDVDQEAAAIILEDFLEYQQ